LRIRGIAMINQKNTSNDFEGILYVEARITFPNNKTKVLEFTGERKFIYNQVMFYSANGCDIQIRERWFN
jgi:hypothetical protein